MTHEPDLIPMARIGRWPSQRAAFGYARLLVRYRAVATRPKVERNCCGYWQVTFNPRMLRLVP